MARVHPKNTLIPRLIRTGIGTLDLHKAARYAKKRLYLLDEWDPQQDLCGKVANACPLENLSGTGAQRRGNAINIFIG